MRLAHGLVVGVGVAVGELDELLLEELVDEELPDDEDDEVVGVGVFVKRFFTGVGVIVWVGVFEGRGIFESSFSIGDLSTG